VCLRELRNIDYVSAGGNQPDNATEFYSEGHYGSTTFDPMDGTEIVVNICDNCIRDRVANPLNPVGYRQVYVPIRCMGFYVGRQYVDSQMVPFTLQEESGDDVVEVTPDQLGEALNARVWWFPTNIQEVRDHIATIEVPD